ncbi:hypothetical protein ACFPRL_04335 [Pseudoclavibacter helvolus]
MRGAWCPFEGAARAFPARRRSPRGGEEVGAEVKSAAAGRARDRALLGVPYQS